MEARSGGLGGGRVPSFWWDAGEPMGMTARRLPALGPQAECSLTWKTQMMPKHSDSDL